MYLTDQGNAGLQLSTVFEESYLDGKVGVGIIRR